MKLRLTFRGAVLALLALVLMLLPPAYGAVPYDSPLASYTKTVYPNGLTLIVKEVHSAPIAAVDVWVGAGAKNETPEESGISHFFEHMLFKGTERRKAGEIAKAIEAVGGYLNAATSLDTTHYYVVVPSQYLDLALDVEADAIMNSTFDPAEIDRERQVILEEGNLKEDNPRQKLGWEAYRAVFAGTPYAKDVLGTAESLAGLTREKFREYHRRYYRPNNMVVAVAGDVDTGAVIRRVGQLFRDFQPQPVPPPAKVTVPVLREVREITITKPVEQTYLYFGFPGPGGASRDLPALEVLGVILGDGKTSRLYRELRDERQLVNEVAAGYQSYQGVGMLAIYAQTKQGDQMEIRRIVTGVLQKIIRQGVTAEELRRAKAKFRSYVAYASESVADIAGILGEAELAGDAGDVARELAAIEKVSSADLRRVARRYLNPAGYVFAVLQPEVKP
jgi:zinc protease